MTRKIIDRTPSSQRKRGETQRPAFTKINDNFAEIYAGLDDAQSALMQLEGRMAEGTRSSTATSGSGSAVQRSLHPRAL